MKKLFLLLVAVLSIGLCASAQTRTVKGTVVDATNDEPLIGASVTAAGNNTMGVTTDADGDFTIVVPANATHLTVSYVGYKAQTVAIGSAKLMIKMEPAANALDEVIAVAYGTAKRSEYTGAASVVKADQLEDALVSNVVSALNGKVSGVQTQSSTGQPGEDPTVRVRGTGSINASSAPLYVVDGVPYMGSISNISAQDIVEMTVLKDAASTALYGARGANGVILITTKKGQEGQAQITLDARWGVNLRGLPNYDVITDSRQWMETYYTAMANTQDHMYNNAAGANAYINQNFWNALGYQTWTLPEGQKIFDANGKFNPYATPGYSDGKYYYIADDWEDATLIHGLRQEYNLSVSGGTDRLQYYLSGSYLEDEGIIKGSHFNRLSTRASVDYQAKKWLKVGTTLSYVYSNTGSPRDQELSSTSGSAFYFINGLAPVYPCYVRDANGNIMYNEIYGEKIYDYGDGRTRDYGNGYMTFGRMPQGNPAGGLLYDKNDYLSDIFDAKWYAVITPIKGLSIVENVGYYLNNQRGHVLLNGLYGQFATMGGQVVQSQARSYDVTLQTLVSYNHTFADVHEMDLMAGYESEEFAAESLSGQGTNLYQPLVPFLGNVIDQKDANGYRRELSHRGFLFRGKYTYDGRYYFMGSVRRDGSSRFAPNHRWGTFWSVSGGWDIAKENFMEEFTNVDLLKFRASFGQNGNDGIGSSVLLMPWADFYVMSGSNGVFNDGSLAQKGNVDLTWETSNAFNIGFDFSFWKGMLSGTVEYYNRQTSDMLFNLPVAPSLGYGSIPSNIGSMRNNGIEIDLNYRPVNTKDITWDIYANITFGWNKILKLPKDILTEVDGEMVWQRGTYQYLREGGSIYDLMLPEYAGVLKTQDELDAITANMGAEDASTYYLGQALYWAREPKYDAEGNQVGWGDKYKTNNWNDARQSNKQRQGRIMPLAYGGFGTTVAAYGFDLSVAFSYQFGGKMIDSGYQGTMSAASVGALHKDVLNAWSPSNPGSDIPSLYTEAQRNYGASLSDRFLVSSNYLQLQNISVGYTLPKTFTRKFGVESLRVYGAAENVALWTKRKGLDPRQVLAASSNFESNNYTYSPIRAISGGLRVTF